MKTLVITGANRGLGMEAAVLFARQSDFQRIILTVRSEAKGVAAVVAASEASGAPASRFRFQVMDLESHQNVRQTVAALPSKIDAIVLNAGGLGAEDITANGVTCNFQMNVLGHAVLIEGLLEAGKLRAGARVVYSGSETTRSVWLFSGLQPFVNISLADIEGCLTKASTRGTMGVAARRRMNLYSASKIIGGLWISQLAKERPEIYFVTVSPGGTFGTDVYRTMPKPIPFVMGLSVTKTAMTWLGAGHSLDVGAKRYVEAVSAASFPDRFPSGSVVGGGSWMGTSGALVEQSSFSSVYTDTAMQEEAARVVRAAMLQ